MNSLKVSILVPFYNVENFVGRCVESLFSQTYDNIEYIFVNDNSLDKSMDIINRCIEKYGVQNKCRMVVHDKNLGIAVSRNDCLDNMSGDYFLFVDSDDYIDTNMVELLIEAALREDADISGCGYVEEYVDYTIEHHQHYSNNHKDMMRSITSLKLKGVMWKLLIRSKLIIDHMEEVRFLPDRNVVEDYLFCCKVFFFAQRFVSVDRCMYHWVQYNPSSTTQTTIQAVENQAAAVRKVEEFYREKGVYEDLEDALLQRKFILKLPLLLNKDCFDVVRWRRLFPESNYMWKNSRNYSSGNKMLFRIALSPFYRLVGLKFRYFYQ